MDFDDTIQGPRDPSLLHLQATHRSKEIWRVGGGDMQRCRHHNPNYFRLPALDHRMIPILHATGFYGVSRVSSLQLDWSLISALVERWRPEIHSFHLPMRECTITLQDVGVLLGLPIDGNSVISDVGPGPHKFWPEAIGSVFGSVPEKEFFNGSRLKLSWFAQITPHRLPDDASEAEVLHHTRCYLMQLFGGTLFTDHSGGMIHPMWIHFVRDLDTCGGYSWGAAVLSFLYRELCKGCRVDKLEIAWCLLLLQLWAWERLPTLAPVRTSQPLASDDFWDGHLAGPLGVRWLVGHSFLEKAGRTLSVTRTILDELAPSHFLWEPYSRDVIDGLPTYYLAGQHIWRYCGPMICIFIVEPHYPDRVARQFGMLQYIPADPVYSSDHHKMTLKGNMVINWINKHEASIAIWNTRLDHIFESELIVGDGTVPEYRAWYLDRTVRFISRLGAFHVRLGGLLQTIANRTQSVMPDVSLLATQGLDLIQDHSLYGFEAFPLEERRYKEKEGRKDLGRRPNRAGGGDRGVARSTRRRVGDVVVDQVVPPSEDQAEAVDPVHDQVEDDYTATNLEDDYDPLDHEGSTIDGGHFDVPDPPTHEVQPSHVIAETRRQPILSYPTFDLGLTPTPQPDQQHPTHLATIVHPPTEQPTTLHPLAEQPPTVHPPTEQPPADLPPCKPVLSYPTFDLGISPPSRDISSQSTSSPQIPLSQASDASDPVNVADCNTSHKFQKVYQVRRSKRVPKPTKCGTDGKKCMNRK